MMPVMVGIAIGAALFMAAAGLGYLARIAEALEATRELARERNAIARERNAIDRVRGIRGIDTGRIPGGPR